MSFFASTRAASSVSNAMLYWGRASLCLEYVQSYTMRVIFIELIVPHGWFQGKFFECCSNDGIFLAAHPYGRQRSTPVPYLTTASDCGRLPIDSWHVCQLVLPEWLCRGQDRRYNRVLSPYPPHTPV